MPIFYDDVKTAGYINYQKADATKYYAQHLKNFRVLMTMLQNKEIDFAGHAQVSAELKICDRKLDYWKRHPNFNLESAIKLSKV